MAFWFISCSQYGFRRLSSLTYCLISGIFHFFCFYSSFSSIYCSIPASLILTYSLTYFLSYYLSLMDFNSGRVCITLLVSLPVCLFILYSLSSGFIISRFLSSLLFISGSYAGLYLWLVLLPFSGLRPSLKGEECY